MTETFSFFVHKKCEVFEEIRRVSDPGWQAIETSQGGIPKQRALWFVDDSTPINIVNRSDEQRYCPLARLQRLDSKQREREREQHMNSNGLADEAMLSLTVTKV